MEDFRLSYAGGSLGRKLEAIPKHHGFCPPLPCPPASLAPFHACPCWSILLGSWGHKKKKEKKYRRSEALEGKKHMKAMIVDGSQEGDSERSRATTRMIACPSWLPCTVPTSIITLGPWGPCLLAMRQGTGQDTARCTDSKSFVSCFPSSRGCSSQPEAQEIKADLALFFLLLFMIEEATNINSRAMFFPCLVPADQEQGATTVSPEEVLFTSTSRFLGQTDKLM